MRNFEQRTKDIYSSGSANIGEIYFPPAINSDPVDLGECVIRIYDYDYDVPHFHLESVDGKYNFSICLETNKYYSHDGRYLDKLTGSQCRHLHDYLMSDTGLEISKITVWENLIIHWDMLNPDHEIKTDTVTDEEGNYKMPNYSTMEDVADTFIKNHSDEPFMQLGILDFSKKEFDDHVLSFTINDIGKCTVSVISDYFHSVPYFFMNTDNIDEDMKKINTSICIYTNQYFDAPSFKGDRLTDDQKNILDEWLRSKNPKLLGNLTNWEHIANMWESLNPESTYPEEKKVKIQPDYKNMKEGYNNEG